MIRKAPISTIMTENVITLGKEDHLEKAEHLFKHHKIRHIPIVNEDAVIGMLSYTDLMRLSFGDISEGNDQDDDVLIYSMLTVNQVMNRKIVTVSSSNTIRQVAEILAVEEFHALPVVDKNRLVGIVTTTDLIKYLLKQF